ncbi:MAG: DivIVA domain-containing protein, partial [Actinomycetota bacterium]|nr:DivIVA domain-containing protein [Actinomycetota bacterium]
MLTVLALLGVIVVMFFAAAVATSGGEVLADAPPDAADLDLPEGPVQPEDLALVRFSMATRGYRMDEVDRVLARAADELASRDALIAELTGSAAPAEVPPPPVTADLPSGRVRPDAWSPSPLPAPEAPRVAGAAATPQAAPPEQALPRA